MTVKVFGDTVIRTVWSKIMKPRNSCAVGLIYYVIVCLCFEFACPRISPCVLMNYLIRYLLVVPFSVETRFSPAVSFWHQPLRCAFLPQTHSPPYTSMRASGCYSESHLQGPGKSVALCRTSDEMSNVAHRCTIDWLALAVPSNTSCLAEQKLS